MGNQPSHILKSPFSKRACQKTNKKRKALSIHDVDTEDQSKDEQDRERARTIASEPLLTTIASTFSKKRYKPHLEEHTPILPPSPTYTSNDMYTTETIIVDGRRYQSYNTKYVLPNDDEEQDRLVQVHFIYKYIFNGNFSAPVHDLLSGPVPSTRRNSSGLTRSRMKSETPTPRVLDLACGNGTWVLEMATEYPNAHFYGIDISPNYPTTIKPPNAFFTQFDILSPKGLPFPDDYFDFVFMRQVYTCFSHLDWAVVIKEIRRVLKPGCYVELRDIDPILKNMGPTTYKLFEKYPAFMKERHGVDIDWAKSMYDCLQQIGQMTNMHRVVRGLQCGKTGPVCSLMNNSLRAGLYSYRYFFQKNYKMSAQEYNRIVDKVVNESIDHQSYFNYYCCWGQKPLYDYTAFQKVKAQSTPNLRNLQRDIVAGSYVTLPPSHSDRRVSLHLPPSPTSTYASMYPLSDDDGHIFGQDSVSDINQFIEGYED